MKVAIITIVLGENYGNKLQNYALQKTLEEFGCEVETIRQKRNAFIKDIKADTKEIIKSIKRTICREQDIYKLRSRRFQQFERKYIKYSHYSFGMNTRPARLSNQYDRFVVGSDQVWNTRFDDIRNNLDNYLAVFADPGKRIAYAASFGERTLEEEFISRFKAELASFAAVSVRELSGVELALQCGKTATLVLDPTLLLSRNEWDELSVNPGLSINRSYVLAYFLGDEDENIRHCVENIAEEKHVIRLYKSWTTKNMISSVEEFTVSPDEFVWLVAHAEFVVTDSYHAAVFSIIYHKPFRIFDRVDNGLNNRMSDRIETLATIFQLNDFRGILQDPSRIPVNQDWEKIESILAAEKEKSLDFLGKAISFEG